MAVFAGNRVSRQGNVIWAFLVEKFILVLCLVMQRPQPAIT